MNGSPWSFDKNLLLLQAYNGKQRPSSLVFSTTTIWIRVQDLLVSEMTIERGKAIADALGRLIEVDADVNGRLKGDHM